MKLIKNVRKEFEVHKLVAKMNVRYWEDATVNGKECSDYTGIFGGEGDLWNITIDINTGIIDNWPSGTVANVHFKVCDGGVYSLLDNNGCVVVEVDDYVPCMLCPEGDGYGDYVIMKIDKSGKIENWSVDLYYFED